ncbi:MAG: hypothetical protein FD168_734 [Desulfobulbaceae bacterium]|nr:MAG: hypothetical protein FD168_734 [Desulfobulbaceae bacterium]
MDGHESDDTERALIKLKNPKTNLSLFFKVLWNGPPNLLTIIYCFGNPKMAGKLTNSLAAIK